MTTKAKISEEVQRIYSRYLDKGNESDVVDIREIYLFVEQALNSALKIQAAESIKVGIYDIPKCNIINYTSTVVSDSANNRAYFELPAIPINLPNDMGLWSVSANGKALSPYIPIPAQDVLVFQGTKLSQLEQHIGYYISGTKVYFTKDITLPVNGSVTSVNVQIYVSDWSKFSDNEMLPISPEIESLVIASVLEMMSNGRVSQIELNSKNYKE